MEGAGRSQGSRQAEIDRRKQYDTEDLEGICAAICDDPFFSTKPAVNQVECHPFFQQRELRELLKEDDVKIEAYQPLGHGNPELLTHPTVTRLAERHQKDPGQIILRFEIQEGFIVLPKSTNPNRIRSNIDLFSFALSDAEMEEMRAMDTGKGNHDPEAPGIAEMLLANYKVHD